MAARIKKGDMVVVITGGDRNKTGKVIDIDNKTGKVLVEGINRVWKHVKPNQRNPQGGRIQKEAYIQASNVMPLDPTTGKGTRVKFQVKDGKKHRIAKSGASISVVGAK
jgi:large subunit ribosomal protein L24